jgi:ATP-dependent RNA helicase DDX35
MSSRNTGGFWKPEPASHREQVLREEVSGESEVPAATFNFASAPIAQQRMLLPIYKHRRQILYSLEHHQIVVIVGETGSGKSTQIPQYLFENGWADRDFQIVCTQPRRIAAQTLALRVATEVGSPLGNQVGYTVRFDNKSSDRGTRIKYVTDGMLLREATLTDPLLSRYSVVMVDEAHERSLNSDALMGILKKIRRKRKDLRIVVCSATIDAQSFLDYFVSPSCQLVRKRKRRWGPRPGEEAPVEEAQGGTIISVDGRQHPVDILYLADPVADYIRSTVETALRIHKEESGGDILCFLPSGEDIDTAIRLADEYETADTSKGKKQVAFLPLYGSLPYQMQAQVFQPKSSSERHVRRIIFATNIAETSVTVPDVTDIIDCGYAKLPYFDAKTGFDRLIVAPISRASAKQRAGRAGRVQSGKCYRLYTEKFMMEKMEEATPPEILRSNLTGFILTLKALGIHNVLSFDLIDLPSIDALSHGLECLYALGAVDDKTELTSRGIDMSAFPTEPRVSRMLLESLDMGCSWEVLAVASVLQVSSIFFQPRTQRQKLDYDAAVSELADRSGDHVTYANLIAEMDDREMDIDECRGKFINRTALIKAVEVRNQLSRFLRKYGRVQAMGVEGEERSRAIRECVTSGFFMNVAKLANDGNYYTVRGKHLVMASQSSILHSHGDTSEYIVFGETLDGRRGGIEIRSSSTIDARWLRELAPHYWV